MTASSSFRTYGDKITFYFDLDIILSSEIEGALFKEHEAKLGLCRNIVSH